MTWVDDVYTFWFDELEPSDWFSGDSALDERIHARFAERHRLLAQRPEVPTDIREALATILVLDQFSRNLHRGTSQAFACDDQALTISRAAVASGADGGLTPHERMFLLMPYMHSESLDVHQEGRPLFVALGLSATLSFADKHRIIIEQFGRYPYRNEALGRSTTQAEREWLEHGDRFGQ